MGTQSKYNEIHRSRVQRQKRTIKLQGSGDDYGKWFRCWHCGFINNIDRNVVGDGEGLSYAIATEESFTVMTGEQSVIINDEGSDVLRTETGSELERRHNIYPVVTSGCLFCGCRNYR